MKLYLVTTDTYDNSYGVQISCYGIATNQDSLKLITDKVINDGFHPNVCEIYSDEIIYEYLGGYYE